MVRPNGTSTVPDRFDVIVIGAGINGAGIARDAAMRKLKVLVIDKGDIGSGTTSASTRLIHGGLRYLEHFEFGLVRESLREREILLRIAPHLVRPLAITIPIYKQSKRGRLTIRAGMILYDLLSWGKSLPGHRILSRAETLERWPGLNSEGLVGSALYYDAQVEFPERLVLENVLSARAFGAEVLTYTCVTDLAVKDGNVSGVEFSSEDGRKRFAEAAGNLTLGWPWLAALGLLLLIYFYVHYGFASITAQATAMFTPFLLVILAAGAPPYLAALSLAYFSNLGASLTHYGNTSAPIYFGGGYVSQRRWWWIGFLASLVNIPVWLLFGFAWWKLLKLW